VTPALARALRALLGLDADAPLPCAATQAELERAWTACAHPQRLYLALWDLGDRPASERALEAWRAATESWARRGDRLDRLPAQAVFAIRAAVPCPVLPAGGAA
jgi:hypothetical protein